jgi:hypothetical protein
MSGHEITPSFHPRISWSWYVPIYLSAKVRESFQEEIYQNGYVPKLV